MEEFESQHMLSKSFQSIIMSCDLLCIEYNSLESSIAARILKVNRGTSGAAVHGLALRLTGSMLYCYTKLYRSM